MTRYDSIEIITAVEMPARARLVYITLAKFTNTENECFPSVKTIAKHANLSVSTVHRAIADLTTLGLISKTARTRDNNGCTSNLYILADKNGVEAELPETVSFDSDLFNPEVKQGIFQSDIPPCVSVTLPIEHDKTNNMKNISYDGHDTRAREEKTQIPEITKIERLTDNSGISDLQKNLPVDENALSDDVSLDEIFERSEIDTYFAENEMRCFAPGTANLLRETVRRLYYTDYLRVDGAVIPRREVRRALEYLNSSTLCDALERLSSKPKRMITSSAKYTAAVVYNSILEMEADMFISGRCVV